jgi:hypothetical protein
MTTTTNAIEAFKRALTTPERRIMAGLTTPNKIQTFLDGVAYSTEEIYRCPLRVLRERIGHCFDGALFAAAALRQLGHQPRILELLPNGRDDDHLLALYQVDGHWGAVAKSNFVGLRSREPVYRSLRELAMSYFEQYYNVAGEKTLAGYTRPLNLKAFDRHNWMTRDEPLDLIADRLDQIGRAAVITPAMAARLSPMDEKSYQAGMLGSDEAGLWKPGNKDKE